MPNFKIEQSISEIYSGIGGISLVGNLLKKHSHIDKHTKKECGHSQVIKHSDIIKSYIGLLSQGKSDYEAIERYRNDIYFKLGLELKKVSSCSTLRQRFDKYAVQYERAIQHSNIYLLVNLKVPVGEVSTGHVPLDIDVFTLDNSETKKEGVSYTYHGYDGYSPIGAYLGADEGWCVGMELRAGSQHSQKDFVPFFKNTISNARKITDNPLLARLDSAHDAIENRVVCCKENVDYIIKANLRNEDRILLAYRADKQDGAFWEKKRNGKYVGYYSEHQHYLYEDEMVPMRRVIRVTKRTCDKKGQYFLEPKFEVEGWWTSLDIGEKEVIKLYNEHGTSEQFHSEFKTDMDIERLPSGKFTTNSLVLSAAAFTYNLLRFIGLGMLKPNAPKRNKVKRRRIKTIMQELMYVACRLVRKARQYIIRFPRDCPVFQTFKELYYI